MALERLLRWKILGTTQGSQKKLMIMGKCKAIIATVLRVTVLGVLEEGTTKVRAVRVAMWWCLISRQFRERRRNPYHQRSLIISSYYPLLTRSILPCAHYL